MAISPFSARRASPEGERRRARLAVLIVTLGIVATLLAYAISPSVRHAVSHAAVSVKHAVSHVFDHDRDVPKHATKPLHPLQPLHSAHRRAPAKPTGASGAAKVTTGHTSTAAGG